MLAILVKTVFELNPAKTYDVALLSTLHPQTLEETKSRCQNAYNILYEIHFVHLSSSRLYRASIFRLTNIRNVKFHIQYIGYTVSFKTDFKYVYVGKP